MDTRKLVGKIMKAAKAPLAERFRAIETRYEGGDVWIKVPAAAWNQLSQLLQGAKHEDADNS